MQQPPHDKPSPGQPPPGESPATQALFAEDDLPTPALSLPEGAHYLPGELNLQQQRWLVQQCHTWSSGPVPLRQTLLPGGQRMSVQSLCLGWHWQPYRYSRTADDVNGQPVLPVPVWLQELGQRLVQVASGNPAAVFRPDAVLVNFYAETARMGMHQDLEEKSDAPVVSISLGDTCLFRFGNTVTRGKPYQDLRLRSGDVFVFGGPARYAYHGVPKIFPHTAPPGCGMSGGRINLTLRHTGLEAPVA